MDYSKVDAPLAAAIPDKPEQGEVRLNVFIHANRAPNEEETKELKELGVAVGPSPKRILTATLSPGAIDVLTEKQWVKSIRLSQRLRPRDEK